MSNSFLGIFYNFQRLSNEIKNALIGIGNLISLKDLYLLWDGITPPYWGASIGLKGVHGVFTRD